MSQTLSELQNTLQKYGQEHLLQFWDTLKPSEQSCLQEQIHSLDLELVQKLSKTLLGQKSSSKLPQEGYLEKDIAPLDAADLATTLQVDKQRWQELGLEALKKGQVAALVVAGGLGTRLGHKGPKGTLNIGLPSKKSLFQIQAQRIQSLGESVSRNIPWYIMTSPNNHRETVEHFKKYSHNLDPEDFFFFSQAQMPAVDTEGKILMASTYSLALSPNGNGGCFLALKDSGALEDMKQRGVQYVFFYSVDNALVQIADPVFIGYMIEKQAPVASKVVSKSKPEEKVGVLALHKNKPSIIEYSDMPKELLELRDDKEELLYNNGNIAIHCFHLNFLEQYGTSSLPYHKAYKKVTYVDKYGDIQVPSQENGYKFELFMFDLFPFASSMATLRVLREEEFAPIKNKEGTDSPASARELMASLYQKAKSKGIDRQDLL
jgi:UDP-N-acetylglucosamine/UDP-N-acetylgalactosamine diphosphorylase